MNVNELIENAGADKSKGRGSRTCCPVCGGTNIRVDDDGGPYDDGINPATGDVEIEYDMFCEDCESTFAQYYKLGSFVRIDGIHKGRYV